MHSSREGRTYTPFLGETAPMRRNRRYIATHGLDWALEGNEYEKTIQLIGSPTAPLNQRRLG
ncbi:MAG: hypothetical protein H7Y22_02095 [Gemmatimonadaceae bacterium]|nr:hypothetical protein [Gloeobacterales cyanobacterium ES-bin-141]